MKKYNISASLFIILALFFRDSFFTFKNVNVSFFLIFYSFTFLIAAFSMKKNKYKKTKNLIKFGFYTYISYYALSLLTILLVNDTYLDKISLFFSNIYSNIIINFSYFDISILALAVVYYLTHITFISLLEAMNNVTTDEIGFVVSLYISFIIDVIITTPVLKYNLIFNNHNAALTLVKALTSSFIVTINLILLLIFVYFLFPKKKH